MQLDWKGLRVTNTLTLGLFISHDENEVLSIRHQILKGDIQKLCSFGVVSKLSLTSYHLGIYHEKSQDKKPFNSLALL